VLVKITITTDDDNLCQIIEPKAPLSSIRFSAVKKLSDNGIYTGILMMPILPFIEDTEENIIKIVNRAKENGAQFIYPAIGMTLRSGNREYYSDCRASGFSVAPAHFASPGLATQALIRAGRTS
jgi:DNA repair photolyase